MVGWRGETIEADAGRQARRARAAAAAAEAAAERREQRRSTAEDGENNANAANNGEIESAAIQLRAEINRARTKPGQANKGLRPPPPAPGTAAVCRSESDRAGWALSLAGRAAGQRGEGNRSRCKAQIRPAANKAMLAVELAPRKGSSRCPAEEGERLTFISQSNDAAARLG